MRWRPKFLRRPPVEQQPREPLTPLEVAMTSICSAKGSIRIVQVGANDGINNDPLSRFITEHRNVAQCLFIEPQEQPLEVLRKYHGDARDFHYVNAAVGAGPTLRLYSVSPRAWSGIVAEYAQDWPDYRAPTGVTSSDRSHVERWLTSYYQGPEDVDALIEARDVQCSPLVELLTQVGWSHGIDVLQIDVEGADDEVIYLSSLETLRPLLVNFEFVNLPEPRQKRCLEYLRTLGYRDVAQGSDMMAVLDAGAQSS